MNWDLIPLHDVLKISKGHITVLDKGLYTYAALHPYPKGMSQKGQKKGTDFRSKQQKIVQSGQFVISKTRFQQGYWGIVQPELDGVVVHRTYLTFDLHPDLKPDYLAAYLATSLFRQGVTAARTKQGRLDIRRFGRITIPLPPIDDQMRIAETWNYAYQALKHTADMSVSITELKAGVASDLFHRLTSDSKSIPLGRSAVIGDDLSVAYPLYVTMAGKLMRSRPIVEESVVGIMPDTELDHHFLQYYLENQRQAWYSAIRNTPLSITSALQTLQIPQTSLYDQRKIVSILQQHDDVLQKLKIEYAELRNLTQGMIQQIFSGNLPPVEAISLLKTI